MHGSSTEVSKKYRYESPERIYSLQLNCQRICLVTSKYSQNAIDIKKYTPIIIINEAVKSLKIE
jgi:hypothetical protein